MTLSNMTEENKLNGANRFPRIFADETHADHCRKSACICGNNLRKSAGNKTL